MNDEQNNLLPVSMEGQILNKTSNQLAKVRENSSLSADYVPHLDINQARRSAVLCKEILWKGQK